MFTFLMVVQYLGILLICGGLAQLFYRKPSRSTQLIVFLLVCFLINQIGECFEMLAKTEAEALVGLQVAYFGRTLVVMFMYIYIGYYTGVRPNLWAKILGFGFQIFVLACVWTCKYNTLYYKSYVFEDGDLFPHLTVEPGIVYYLFIAYLVIMMFLSVSRCIIRYRHSDSKRERAQIRFIAVMPLISLSTFAFYKLGVMAEYDCTNLSYIINTLLLLICVKKFELVETVSLAKDDIVDELTDAILVVNAGEDLVYQNKQAKKIFAATDESTIIQTVEQLHAENKELWIDDKVYAVRRKENVWDSKTSSATYIVYDNTMNYKLAYEDGLTHVSNRRALIRSLDELHENSEKMKRSEMFLVIMDIDDFKSINDKMGHQIGDESLQLFANTLVEKFSRKAVYRFGGDEFVLIVEMPACELVDKLAGVNERLADASNAHPFHTSGGYVRITGETTLDELMKQADDALYEVKKTGKGRFVRAE